MDFLEGVISSIQFIIDIVISTITSFLNLTVSLFSLLRSFVIMLPAPFTIGFATVLTVGSLFFIYKFVR